MNISRRFFLGGAISLAAAVTFKPSLASIGNMPKIYGDSVHDDAEGIGALFRNEPVIFNTEMIGVDSHEGITFHRGHFVVNNTINIPKNTKIHVEMPTFVGTNLPDDFPFFSCEDFSGHGFASERGPGARFEIKPGKKGLIIEVKNYDRQRV